MKKNLFITIIITLAIIVSAGVFIKNEQNKKHTSASTSQNKVVTSKQRRIVNLSPSFYSMLLMDNNIKKNVVGTVPDAFNHANLAALRKVDPKYKKVNTEFAKSEFNINGEELLSLKPTTIYYYGEFQTKSLPKSTVNLISVHPAEKDVTPKAISVANEQQLYSSLKKKNPHLMEHEWKKTEAELKTIRKVHVRAMILYSDNDGKVYVSGKNSPGDGYLKEAGLTNVANNVSGNTQHGGQVQVNMEQIMKWNPQVIFVNTEDSTPSAKQINKNAVQQQDWSQVSAFKKKAIYSFPVGIYPWGIPGAEAPLVPYWMASRVYPKKISTGKVIARMKGFYETIFHTKINTHLANNIMNYADKK